MLSTDVVIRPITKACLLCPRSRHRQCQLMLPSVAQDADNKCPRSKHLRSEQLRKQEREQGLLATHKKTSDADGHTNRRTCSLDQTKLCTAEVAVTFFCVFLVLLCALSRRLCECVLRESLSRLCKRCCGCLDSWRHLVCCRVAVPWLVKPSLLVSAAILSVQSSSVMFHHVSLTLLSNFRSTGRAQKNTGAAGSCANTTTCEGLSVHNRLAGEVETLPHVFTRCIFKRTLQWVLQNAIHCTPTTDVTSHECA